MGRIINVDEGRTETMEMRLRYGTKERVLQKISEEKCRFPEMYFFENESKITDDDKNILAQAL